MSKGILVFARNNAQVDYVKQAYFLALRAKTYLNLPVTVVTDSKAYMEEHYKDWNDVFDNVISIVWKEEDVCENTTLSKTENHTIKTYQDGTLIQKHLEFKNETRTLAYDLSPYDETLMLDTDIVIADDKFLHCFEQTHDFLIYKDAYDLAHLEITQSLSILMIMGLTFTGQRVYFLERQQKIKYFLICCNTFKKIGSITVIYSK